MAATDSAAPTAPAGRTHPQGNFARILFFTVAALLAVALFLAYARHMGERAPSFDGAMNLQVAWSLAEGDGYRRTYAERDAFPHEIQTNAPFAVLGALVYKVAGVGVFQSQLPNILYLGLFALALFLHARRRFHPATAPLVPLFVLCTPGILLFGSSGYGEIPALAWVAASVVAFQGGDRRAGLLLAGLCVGLALATKTVLIGACGAFGLGYAVLAATDGRFRWPRRIAHLALLAAGFLLPLLAVEAWKLASLGTWEAYLHWWSDELPAIGSQAGTSAGFADTDGRLAKLGAHGALLSKFLALPLPLLAIWIVAPLLLGLRLLFERGGARRHAVFFMIVGAALLYLAWWLLVTPTQKAWHRRILDGALLVNWAWAYLAAWGLSRAWTAAGALDRAARGCIALVPLALFGLLFLRGDALRILPRTPDLSRLEAAVAAIRALPPDAHVFGIGWNSGPRISLLAERPFLDFNDASVREMRRLQPAFLVVDTATPAANYRNLLRMYPSRPLLEEGGLPQIYALDLDRPAFLGDEASAAATRGGRLDHMDDGAVRGFQGPGQGGRWMGSDSLVLLAGSPDDSVLHVKLFLPPVQNFAAQPPSLALSINGCPVRDVVLPAGGVHHIRAELPEACRSTLDGQDMLHLQSNAVVDKPITVDDRALFAIVNEAWIGDVDAPSPADAPAAPADDPTPAEPVPALEAPPGGLVVTPVGSIDCTDPRTPFQATVAWNAGRPGNLEIRVADGGQPEKLWIATGHPLGNQVTGPWTRSGTRFIMRSADGRIISTAAAEARCR